MAKMDPTKLRQLALALARKVVDPENVDHVEVEPGLSWDGTLSYRFHVFVDPALADDKLADLRFALLRGLRDALDEHGDEHEVFTSMRSSMRARAEPSGA